MNRTIQASIKGRANTSSSKPVVVNYKEMNAALNAAMKRKGLNMDHSGFKRRAK